MKRNIKLFLIVGLLLIEVFTVHLAIKSYDLKDTKSLQINQKNNTQQFALMVEQTKGKGDYQDSSTTYHNSFPAEGYKLNEAKSNCTDINGKTIENAITYDSKTYSITINANKTAYCYLYYDIYEKTITTLE